MKFYNTTSQFRILMQRLLTRQNLKELFFVVLGTFITALPIYFIYNPLKLVSGGVGGVGIVIESLTKGVFKTSYTFWIGNIFALILALVVFGKFYFFKTIVGSLTLPLFILIFELTVSPTYFVEKLFFSIDKKTPVHLKQSNQCFATTNFYHFNLRCTWCFFNSLWSLHCL